MNGALRLVFRHFPLTQIHPHAEHAAEAAEAAAERDKFWQMHHLLFTHQDALDDLHLAAYAGSLGIDPAWVGTVLRARIFAEAVQEDFKSGVRSGVNGTPTFFINGVRNDGPWDEPTLLLALEAAARAVAALR
jgi:protein-disulfide isomerase